jgi:S-(hydroxymethyl)glutathione dehydrogenase/alcohol dehydrogenase
MKAAVMYERHNPLVLDDVDLTDPAANEVEVELVASGVCHSDLHHLERETPIKPPVVLGHEGAGVVKSVGVNVTRVKPGDHVITERFSLDDINEALHALAAGEVARAVVEIQ